MKDYYPTRKTEYSYFINRHDPVVYTDNEAQIFDIRDYEKNGFTLIKNWLDKDLIKTCFRESERLYEKPGGYYTNKEPIGNKVRSLLSVHKHPLFESLMNSARIVDCVEDILGSNLYLHQSRINYKAGLQTNGWSWHSDFETWHSQDGMPKMRCVTAMIPLIDNTPENGALMVVPKSHKVFWCSKKSNNESAESEFSQQTVGVPDNDALVRFFELSNGEIKTLVCEPGDLVIFDCNTIHVSNPNLTPNKRTNLFFVYNHMDNQLVQPYAAKNHRPEEMGAINNIVKINKKYESCLQDL